MQSLAMRLPACFLHNFVQFQQFYCTKTFFSVKHHLIRLESVFHIMVKAFVDIQLNVDALNNVLRPRILKKLG